MNPETLTETSEATAPNTATQSRKTTTIATMVEVSNAKSILFVHEGEQDGEKRTKRSIHIYKPQHRNTVNVNVNTN